MYLQRVFSGHFLHAEEPVCRPVDGGTETLRARLDRAMERGEILEENLAPPVDTLLGVLFRDHVLMTFSPPPEALRTAWVDRIFLPLLRNWKSQERCGKVPLSI